MTLDYTTAKALRDCGFPQDHKFLSPDCDCENRTVYSEAYWKEKKYDEFAYSPTLPELIQQLGDIEFTIHCYPAKDELNPNPWFIIERPNIMDMERQDTPELACANLYLSIHKK